MTSYTVRVDIELDAVDAGSAEELVNMLLSQAKRKCYIDTWTLVDVLS